MPNFIPFMLRSRSRESEILETRSRESDILPPTPQPWYCPPFYDLSMSDNYILRLVNKFTRLHLCSHEANGWKCWKVFGCLLTVQHSSLVKMDLFPSEDGSRMRIAGKEILRLPWVIHYDNLRFRSKPLAAAVTCYRNTLEERRVFPWKHSPFSIVHLGCFLSTSRVIHQRKV